MTASIRSPGSPKRKWASMTSRPLFIIVAESIVILGPIFHVGCASASSTVIASKVSSRRSRNGPPDAVSTMRDASPFSRDDEWLLVGEGEAFSRAHGGVGRAQTQSADQPADDGVRLGMAGGFLEPLASG